MASAREKLERRWHALLKDASLHLEFTRNSLTELYQESQAGALVGMDRCDVAEALREEHAALQEFRRILRIYKDLVLDGKIPDEDYNAATVSDDN